MMKWVGLTVAALFLAAPSNASAGELRLSIANGRVTLIAQDVSLQQILTEWARVGQTQVVGAERLSGPLVTLELHDVPEARALDTLLRSASGYIAKPRVVAAGASTYDRILIMPKSQAPPAALGPAPTRAMTQPMIQMPNAIIDDDGEPTGTPPVLPPGAVAPGQYPYPQQFNGQPMNSPQVPGFQPPPGQQPGQQQPMLTRPGMLPQAPGGTPGNPYAPPPNMPVRPPGAPGPGGGGDDGK